MSDHQKLKETLSALIDHEAGKQDQLELRRLVKALEEYPDLLETYQRYTLVQQVLHGETVHATSPALVSRVRAALENEDSDVVATSVMPLSPRATGFGWLKTGGRVAIAASVAVCAVYLVQILSPVSGLPSPVAATPVVEIHQVPASQNHRVLKPSVLAVSATDNPAFRVDGEQKADLPAGCVVSPLRDDNRNLVWEKKLPEGYVLCKQGGQANSCESVSTKVACYLD